MHTSMDAHPRQCSQIGYKNRHEHEASDMALSDQLGFGRPGGQKSNKSNASHVHGPSSITGGGSGTALMALRMSVGRVWRAGLAVNAVGSDSDLRSGASSDLLAGRLRGVGEWVFRLGTGSKVGVSAISSRMN